MLQIAAMINPQSALTLAQSIDMRDLDMIAREEMNLGRLAVLLSGLAETSRRTALNLVERFSTDGLRVAQLEENENLRNVWHFARTLTRVSKRAGAEYVDFIMRNIGHDIIEFADAEANVMEISNWLRVLSAKEGLADSPLVARLIPCLDEAKEYDSQIWHLLEAERPLPNAIRGSMRSGLQMGGTPLPQTYLPRSGHRRSSSCLNSRHPTTREAAGYWSPSRRIF